MSVAHSLFSGTCSSTVCALPGGPPKTGGSPRCERASAAPRIARDNQTAWAVRGSLERRRAQMKNHSTQRATILGKTASYINRHHLALFALFFALGGTSFAAGKALLPSNSVGTKQVINGSLQTNDLSKTARSALKDNTGLRGPAGPAGAQGAQGAQGATGATGAQGVQGVPGQSATKLFVALDADGTLTKNSGATLASYPVTGVYRITFNTDITN